MREACLSIFKIIWNFRVLLVVSSILLCLVAIIPCYAQLPPTNMGQFVHQPGDNQYTNQTQAERHSVAVPMAVPVAPVNAAPPANAVYKPTPAAPKPDISLMPIVADEPIKPAGFPPLPDRLDLPGATAGVWTNGGLGIAGAGGSSSTVTMGDGIDRNPQGVHQHYVHYAPGAFMPNQPIQQTTYKPSSSDYYNVNPNAKAGMANATTAPIETPAQQALKHMGPEPQLAGDRVSKPEAPTAVTVNQSVSQDLSLPEDDFNKHYPTPIANSKSNRMSRGMGRMLVYPLRSAAYSAAGMAAGAASYARSYAYYR